MRELPPLTLRWRSALALVAARYPASPAQCHVGDIPGVARATVFEPFDLMLT